MGDEAAACQVEPYILNLSEATRKGSKKILLAACEQSGRAINRPCDRFGELLGQSEFLH